MSNDALHITATIGGREVARDEVLERESKRLLRASRKLGTPLAAGAPSEQRQALSARKVELGRDRLERMLAKEGARSGRFVHAISVLSGARRRRCSIEITATGITGEEFVKWFHTSVDADDEPAMLAAHPEHFVVHTTSNGQEVYERLGGAPFVSHFFIDFTDTRDLKTPTLTDHPFRIVGAAILPNGRRVGGAKHQFRNTTDGLHAVLSIDFPLFIPPAIALGHRWHLAIEFSNWIEAAHRSLATDRALGRPGSESNTPS